MIYILIFILLFLFSLTKGKTNNRYYRVLLILLLVITCCRSYTVGIDTSTGYYSYYYQVLGGGTLSWVEPTWLILNKICIWLKLGYPGVLAFSGILTIIPISFVINKTCENKCFALAVYYGLYYVLYSFNMIRQCIAVSFAIVAIYYYINNKYVKASVWLVFSIMFHNSALVVLPLILFLKIHLSFKKLLLVLFLTFLAGLLLSNRVFFVLSGQYANNLLLTDGYTGFRNSIIIPAIMAVFLNVFFAFIVWPEYETVRNDKWFLVSILGIIVMNLTLRLGQGTRIVLYFSQAQMVFIPNYIQRVKNKNNRTIILMLYIMYISINFYRILHSQWDSLVPYKFFWNDIV